MDYAEPLIKAKQALKDYEQAVLHGKWDEAVKHAMTAFDNASDIHVFAWIKRNAQSKRGS